MWIHLALGAALIANVLLLYEFSPFVTDDALIAMRYARHLTEGYGLAWNPGAGPVEGYSNFLYVMLAAGALKLG